MQFVSQHFTRHHLRHAPHRFLAALLLSPIHAAELYYKHKYHLNFAHAKKLFALDLGLLFLLLFLGGATIFWFTYRPGTKDLIGLSIAVSERRIKSGERLTFTIHYQNNSPVTLRKPTLKLVLADSLVVNEDTTFTLPDLSPGAAGAVSISGRLFAPAGEESVLAAHLTYTSPTRLTEDIITGALLTTRDSVLELKTAVPEMVINHGTAPLQLTLTNTGDEVINDIRLPFSLAPGLTATAPVVEEGTVTNEYWTLSRLAPGQSYQLSAQLQTSIEPTVKQINLALTPEIKINGRYWPQIRVSRRLTVLHPRLAINANWEGEPKARPGEIKVLRLELINQSAVTLTNVELTLNLPRAVVAQEKLEPRLFKLKTGNEFVVKASVERPLPTTLNPEQRVTLNLPIPIHSTPSGGTDPSLRLSPKVTALVSGVPDGVYTRSLNTAPLRIGTTLHLTAELRYYTIEGDQLGRGPLPPQVGKTTKYWTLLEIANTTSRVENATLVVHLAPGINWTGRASVSQAALPNWNATARTLTWHSPVINPHENATINFELSLLPLPPQRGTTPLLIERILLTGEDTYLNESIRQERGALDVSLPSDQLARTRGVVVE